MRFLPAKKWFIVLAALAALLLCAAAIVPGQVKSALLGPEGHYFESGGVRIHYTDDGQGTPVLLVHGLANPANLQWRRLGRIEALSKHYRVIALDNRGHGRSGKPHDPEQYGARMAEDLVALLDHLGIQKAHVVGYSMGGFITLKLVATHPDRLLSAAVCGAGWEQPTPENLAFSEAVAEAFEHGEAGPLRKRLDATSQPFSLLERMAIKVSLSWFNDPLALAAVARASHGLDVTEEELRANQVPVLTIIGAKDGLLPDAEALHAHMAHHELVVLPNKTHMNADVAGAFLQNLEQFLQEHTPKPSL